MSTCRDNHTNANFPVSWRVNISIYETLSTRIYVLSLWHSLFSIIAKNGARTPLRPQTRLVPCFFVALLVVAWLVYDKYVFFLVWFSLGWLRTHSIYFIDFIEFVFVVCRMFSLLDIACFTGVIKFMLITYAFDVVHWFQLCCFGYMLHV